MDVLDKFIKEIESVKKTCPHDSHSHCMEEMCAIWEPDGWNAAVDAVIKHITTSK